MLNSLKKNIKNFEPDLIFVTYDYLTPFQVDEVKRIINSPIILWYPDALIRFNKAYFMNSNYDYLLKTLMLLILLKRFWIQSILYA